jgi:hypothetical protein
MQRFRPETMFEEFLENQPTDPTEKFSSETRFVILPQQRQEHADAIRTIQNSLNRLVTSVSLSANDLQLMERVRSLMEAIGLASPPQSAKGQFEQLYHLRKLLFWLPADLLSSRKGDVHTLLLLSYFYSSAVMLEPAFPDVGVHFFACLAAPPLSAIIDVIQACQHSPEYSALSQRAAELMDIPRGALSAYRSRRDWHSRAARPPPVQIYQPSETLTVDLMTQLAEQGSHTPSLSPAFASSTISTMTPHPRSPFLEVPGSAVESPYSAYKLFTPTTGSFQSTPTSAYGSSSSVLLSPAMKVEHNDGAGYDLPIPEYASSRHASENFVSMSMPPPLIGYTMGSSPGGGGGVGGVGVGVGVGVGGGGGGGYVGGSASNSVVGGCVPTAVWT